jgi:hypothetical protein
LIFTGQYWCGIIKNVEKGTANILISITIYREKSDMQGKYHLFVICFIFLGVLLIGCSTKSPSPVVPSDTPSDISQELPYTDIASAESNRILLGAWTMNFDYESMTASVEPDRSAFIHYQAKNLIPTPEVVIDHKNPEHIVFADVTLTNPYPFDVFDVRMIIMTDEDGHTQIAEDNWTGLFDIAGGEDINPFRDYSISSVERKFPMESNLTKRLYVYNPPNSCPIHFTVDASYPSNCEEPYKITNFVLQDYLYENVGANTYGITCVYDWQDDVSEVYLHCPEITDELESYFYQHSSPDWWELHLVNNAGAPHGVYQGVIAARSANSGSLAIYNKIEIHVTEGSQLIIPGFQWVKTWGGSDLMLGGDQGNAVIVDNSGDVYVAGSFFSEVDFGDGNPIQSNGWNDAFLTKYDSNGEFIRVVTWGGSSSDFVHSVVADDSGNVYVASSFSSAVDFGDGNPIQPNGNSDGYLLKLDSNGDFISVKTYSGSGCENPASTVIDNFGNIFVAGYFDGEVDFGDGNPIQANGTSDVFLTKYDFNDDFDWVRTWGGLDYDYGISVAVDGQGNAYITGGFYEAIDFGDGNPIQSNGIGDIFVCRFDSNGDFIWAKTWGGVDHDKGTSVAVDNSGNVYATGFFQEEVDFGDGNPIQSIHAWDVYLVKHNQDGDFVWVETWGGHNDQYPKSVAVDKADKVYVAGVFYAGIDFGDGNPIQAIGGSDAFFSKFDSNGDLIWVKTWGGLSSDFARSIAFDESGDISEHVYVTGSFKGTVNFGDGNPIQSNGGGDAYLSKFSIE